MYELQAEDHEGSDGWIGIHCSPSQDDLVQMGQDLEPYVRNSLRVIERVA